MRVSFINGLIIAQFILYFSALGMAEGASTDPRLHKLIQQFANWQGYNMTFDDPRSPLYPYRHDNFEDGLSGSALAELHRLEEAGRCNSRYRDLHVEGFFGLHPYLIPALFRDPLGSRLADGIRWRVLQELDRCLYRSSLSKLRRRVDTSRFEPFDGGPSHPEALVGNHELQLVSAQRLFWALSTDLAILAFCKSNPPSIREVLSTANQKGGLKISVQEAIYLTGRARLHRLISEEEAEAALTKFRQEGMLKIEIERIYSASQRHKLRSMFPLQGYWQLYCREQ